jgi:hypothetical protein
MLKAFKKKTDCSSLLISQPDFQKKKQVKEKGRKAQVTWVKDAISFEH